MGIPAPGRDRVILDDETLLLSTDARLGRLLVGRALVGGESINRLGGNHPSSLHKGLIKWRNYETAARVRLRKPKCASHEVTHGLCGQLILSLDHSVFLLVACTLVHSSLRRTRGDILLLILEFGN